MGETKSKLTEEELKVAVAHPKTQEMFTRQWVGINLVNIYERFGEGGELTRTENDGLKSAILFFVPGYKFNSEEIEKTPMEE